MRWTTSRTSRWCAAWLATITAGGAPFWLTTRRSREGCLRGSPRPSGRSAGDVASHHHSPGADTLLVRGRRGVVLMPWTYLSELAALHGFDIRETGGGVEQLLRSRDGGE